MPKAVIPLESKSVVDILLQLKLVKSKGEAKRLIQGGGVSINSNKVASYEDEITAENIENGFVLHKGKKTRINVVFE